MKKHELKTVNGSMENCVREADDTYEKSNDIKETPDDILIKLGGCGRYQVLLVFIIQLMKTVVCFSMVGNAFFAYVPSWRCVDGTVGSNVTDGVFNSTGNASDASLWTKQCKSNGKACYNFEYDSSISTLVNQFDLVCDKSWVTATITSVQMAGMCLGSAVVGPLADQLGRRNPFMAGILLMCVCQAVAYFSTHWIMYAIMKFMIGIGCAFFLSIYGTIQSEYTLSRWRAVVISFPSWALESSIFALLAYVLHDWKNMTLLTTILSFIFLSFWAFIPESFRWYVSKDQFSEAEKTVKNVAKWNRHKIPDVEPMRTTLAAQQEYETKNKLSLFVLFKTKEQLRLTVPLTVVWLSLGLVSYGVNFGIQKLSGDIYLNLFLFAIASIPSKIVSILLANRFGRRVSTSLAFAFTGLAGLVVGIVQNTGKVQYVYRVTVAVTPYRDNVTNVCALAASSGIDWAWGPVQTMTLEVYPTVVRNTGFGVLSVLARVGAVIGPQLVYLSDFAPGLLYFVISVLALLSIIATLSLPETKDKELLDKVPSNFGDKRKKEHAVY